MQEVAGTEAEVRGYDGRTQRLFRVPRWWSELSRLRELHGQLCGRLTEVEHWISRLEAHEEALRQRVPPLHFSPDMVEDGDERRRTLLQNSKKITGKSSVKVR